MKCEEVRNFLIDLGWKAPRGRHLYITRANGVRLRIVFKKTTVRIEREVKLPADAYSPERSVWGWLGGTFYSRIVKLPGRRIRIGSLLLGPDNVDGMGSKGK